MALKTSGRRRHPWMAVLDFVQPSLREDLSAVKSLSVRDPIIMLAVNYYELAAQSKCVNTPTTLVHVSPRRGDGGCHCLLQSRISDRDLGAIPLNQAEDRMLSYQSSWLQILIHQCASVLQVDACGWQRCIDAQVCMGRQLHLICRMPVDYLLGRFPKLYSLAPTRLQMM